MRTDPREACKNEDEKLLWAIVHDLICHPLMAATNYSQWSLRFHDWTSRKAWPRAFHIVYDPITLFNSRYGKIVLQQQSPIIWKVSHPNLAHAVVFKADDEAEALYKALAWFDTLATEFGGVFEPRWAKK